MVKTRDNFPHPPQDRKYTPVDMGAFALLHESSFWISLRCRQRLSISEMLFFRFIKGSTATDQFHRKARLVGKRTDFSE